MACFGLDCPRGRGARSSRRALADTGGITSSVVSRSARTPMVEHHALLDPLICLFSPLHPRFPSAGRDDSFYELPLLLPPRNVFIQKTRNSSCMKNERRAGRAARRPEMCFAAVKARPQNRGTKSGKRKNGTAREIKWPAVVRLTPRREGTKKPWWQFYGKN